MGWNPKVGNTVKDNVVRAGLVVLELVEHGRSRMKITVLTPPGQRIISEHGISCAAVNITSA